MALSEYEKRVLAEMEQHLRQQDPDLADSMASTLPTPPQPEEAPAPRALSPRRIALGSIMAAVGLALVVVGVSISSVWGTILLGAAGFVTMVIGVLYALSADKKASKPSADSPASPPRQRPTRQQREEQRRDRWENRK